MGKLCLEKISFSHAQKTTGVAEVEVPFTVYLKVQKMYTIRVPQKKCPTKKLKGAMHKLACSRLVESYTCVHGFFFLKSMFCMQIYEHVVSNVLSL